MRILSHNIDSILIKFRKKLELIILLTKCQNFVLKVYTAIQKKKLKLDRHQRFQIKHQKGMTEYEI